MKMPYINENYLSKSSELGINIITMIIGMIFIVFFIGKINGLIQWNWIWITSPMWILGLFNLFFELYKGLRRYRVFDKDKGQTQTVKR